MATIEKLGDLTEISIPDKNIVIDKTVTGNLDEAEYSIWNTFIDFINAMGITLVDMDSVQNPDWATVKAIEETMFGILEKTGCAFEFPNY